MGEPAPPGGLLHFPEGLPGFEHLTRFVLLQERELLPIVFLQSLDEPPVCLPVVPVERLSTNYCLEVTAADRLLLQLDSAGSQVLCLAILHLGDGRHPVTANLMAPIVVNLKNWTAKQVIQIHSPYSTLAEVS